MTKSLTERIKEIRKKEGNLTLLKKITIAILSKLFWIEKIILYELDLEKNLNIALPTIDVDFRLATRKDIENLDNEEYGFEPIDKKYSLKRLEKGDKCVLAIHNKEIIGYISTMYGEMELSRVKHISLPNNKLYSYNGFVKKEFRGNRIHSGMFYHINDLGRKNGKKYGISAVFSRNKPAIKAKTRQKDIFRVIGKIKQITIFGKDFVLINKKYLEDLRS